MSGIVDDQTTDPEFADFVGGYSITYSYEYAGYSRVKSGGTYIGDFRLVSCECRHPNGKITRWNAEDFNAHESLCQMHNDTANKNVPMQDCPVAPDVLNWDTIFYNGNLPIVKVT
jgi:hypothetical protein